MRRKIQKGELAPAFESSSVVSAGSFNGAFKPAQSLIHDAGFVDFIRAFRHALKSASITPAHLHVCAVFLRGAEPKIGAAVIEAVAVYMINLHTLLGMQQQAMHQSVSVGNRIGIAAGIQRRAPLELANELIISRINDSYVAAGERDLARHAAPAIGLAASMIAWTAGGTLKRKPSLPAPLIRRGQASRLGDVFPDFQRCHVARCTSIWSQKSPTLTSLAFR